MTQRRRRGPVGRSEPPPARFPFTWNPERTALKLSSLPRNLIGDAERIWNLVIKSPFQAVGGMVSFLAAAVSLLDALEKAFGWGDGGSSAAGSPGGSRSGILDGLLAIPTGTLLAYAIAASSIGWSIATLTSWLTKSRNDALNALGYVIAAVAGLLLSFVSQNFLISNTSGGAFEPDIGLLITVAGIAAAVMLAKTCYRVTRETALPVIEKRALTLMIFTVCAAASTLLQLSTGK